MDSLLALIFLSLQQRIIAETHVRHVNEDSGQLADEQPAISRPCVLISFQLSSFTGMAQNCQLGRVTVSLKIITEPHSSSANNTPDKFKKLALSAHEIEHEVHQALQGWSPGYLVEDEDILQDVTGSLTRISSQPDNSRADLRIRQVTYNLGIDDYGTHTWQEYVPVTGLLFDGEIVLDVEV